METQARFDLNQAIAGWRTELAAHPGLTDDNLRELESHLREAVATDVKLGSSEREAFATALNQIGESSRLASEFALENTGLIWRQRLFWMALAALVLPALLGLPGLLLSVAARWLQGAGYNTFARVLYDNSFSLVVSVVPSALVIGLLLMLSRGRRLTLKDCGLWLYRHVGRLLAAAFTAALLWLGLYAYTEHSHRLLQLLNYLALGVTVIVVILTLPERCGATGIRRALSWLVAGRIRLGVLLSLLVLMPMTMEMRVYFMPGLDEQTIRWMELYAGIQASMVAMKLLLVGVVIGFQPSIGSALILNAPAPGASLPDGRWRQWSIWMCAGCLFLVAWGVIQTGLNELMIRGIDQWWARALIGIGLPLAIAGWVWRPSNSTPRAVVIKSAQTVSSSGLRIVSVALLLALLGFGVKWLQLETAMQFSGAGQSSILYGFQTQAWLLMMNLIWPAALLGLLLDQMTRHHDHARKT
ncbi:MAG TPA: hypothetical protein VLD18_16815 [Verrucomicrobiae bacterium]|nr:hypothetical protein [Verrucomicrobiae bacterium]